MRRALIVANFLISWGSLGLLAIPFLCPGLVTATVYEVKSAKSFNKALACAEAGDTIVWQNGVYSNENISIDKSNLTIIAETPGGVTFEGKSTCKISGNYNIFSGFQYIGEDIGSNQLIVVEGSHNKITQINMKNINAYHYVVFSAGSQYNELSHCNIEGKLLTDRNSAVQIHLSPTEIGHHIIKHCSFLNFPGPGGDAGNEPIRIGLSTEKNNISRTIVEYCYFENVGRGDNESISIKSAENVIRYNTFSNNPEGMLVFRQGYRNAAYGNFFINGSGGIRLKGGGTDYIYNNYFQTGTAEAVSLNFEEAFPLEKVYILHNTFIECAPLDITIAGPKSIMFANNIFQKRSGPIVEGITSEISFIGNIINGSFGIAIPDVNKAIDPMLVLNGDYYFGLSADSPAKDASNPNYPHLLDIPNLDDDYSIMMDIKGNPRPNGKSMKDIGCEEYSPGGARNHPLKLSDVGPAYLQKNVDAMQ